MSRRLQAMGVEKYKDNFAVRTHESALNDPYKWKGSKIVFVNSMSDLFHPDIPVDFIKRVFAVMNDLPQHIFQVLTKRSGRLAELSPLLNWTPNIWMGTSVEDEQVMFRIDELRQCGAETRFLSLEPLIGPLPDMNLNDIGWVIVGGESGHRARPMEKEWVIDIKEQCLTSEVPFFFKQWGGKNKKKAGRDLDGRTWDEMPVTHAVV
jgi:protein gp37